MQETLSTGKFKPVRGSGPTDASDTCAKVGKKRFPVPNGIQLEANLDRLLRPPDRGPMSKEARVNSVDDAAGCLGLRHFPAYESWAWPPSTDLGYQLPRCREQVWSHYCGKRLIKEPNHWSMSSCV